MAGGGQMATATQAPAFSSGQTYGGMPIGNAYAQQQPQQQPQQMPQSMQQVQQMAQQRPHGVFSDQSMDDGMMSSSVYNPQPQTPLGIAGLQNNLPSSVGMGGMGGMGGTDVIVHGMPVNNGMQQNGLGDMQKAQQGMDALSQQLRGQQQTTEQRYKTTPEFLV
jgi:hypothetical protein